MIGDDIVFFYQTENVGEAYECRGGVHENWIISPHIHEYSEILFTKKGVTYICIADKKYPVPENHLIFIRSNQIHEFTGESPSIFCSAVFSNDFIPLFNLLTLGKELESPVVDFSDKIQLLEAFEKADKTDIMKICGLINLICSVVLEKGKWTPSRNGGQKQIDLRQIIEYVSINFKEDITLSHLAKRLGYHEKYLSSALHSITGMNFKEFVASYKIDHAKKLLRSSSKLLKISEIALESGFSSLNTFNRMFLKLVGTTPSEYRKQKSK